MLSAVLTPPNEPPIAPDSLPASAAAAAPASDATQPSPSAADMAMTEAACSCLLALSPAYLESGGESTSSSSSSAGEGEEDVAPRPDPRSKLLPMLASALSEQLSACLPANTSGGVGVSGVAYRHLMKLLYVVERTASHSAFFAQSNGEVFALPPALSAVLPGVIVCYAVSRCRLAQDDGGSMGSAKRDFLPAVRLMALCPPLLEAVLSVLQQQLTGSCSSLVTCCVESFVRLLVCVLCFDAAATPSDAHVSALLLLVSCMPLRELLQTHQAKAMTLFNSARTKGSQHLLAQLRSEFVYVFGEANVPRL